jgi:Ni/Fe-hydrogenase 1 B-type cytochrome subunit
MTTKVVTPHSEQAVYVYEAPLRLWHWTNALAIVMLCITGYLIGSPLPAMSGEASDHYLMGYIRFTHFSAAYILAVGFLFRLYWAFAGNEHARQLILPPFFKAHFWDGVWHEIKWYAFLVKEPRKYVGHNPLAMVAMHFMLAWGTVFMIFTGFAMYGEGAQQGSWANSMFSSWLIPMFGQSQDVHTWHHLGMWMIICFMIIHIYAAIREDMMSRQSMVSTMISGWRTFKDKARAEDE